MKLSIVIPIFNEDTLLHELKSRLDKIIPKLDCLYEIIFVDDGSWDDTPEILQQFLEKDHRMTVVRLSRNFGHQQAITAGISIADGDALILMDGDLEDPPELISDLLEKWKQGYSVVLARRKSRQASFFRKLLLNGFYKVFQFLSDFPIPLYSGVFCLLDRRAYHQILNFSERNRFIPGLRSWIGFKTAEIWFDREERHSGKPKQTIWRLIKYASDAIFSFSYKPLRLSLVMGLFIFFLSSIYTFIILILRLLQINVVSGFTTIAMAVFFFGSTILVSNGIIGEYLGRIYDEVKQRPLYIIDEVIRLDGRGSVNPEQLNEKK